jgi:hypothetical protein
MGKHSQRFDHARIERLTQAVLQPLVANYKEGPKSADRIYEMLNALGVGLAIVLAGLDDAADRAKARRFFNHAVRANLEEVWRRGRTLAPEQWPTLHGGPSP